MRKEIKHWLLPIKKDDSTSPKNIFILLFETLDDKDYIYSQNHC